jgi:hypothetical protein
MKGKDCGANGQRGGRELPYGAVGMEMESRHLSVRADCRSVSALLDDFCRINEFI